MILIGSRAVSIRLGSIFPRKPLDFDFICTEKEYEGWMEKNSSKINAKEIYPLEDNSKMIVKGDSILEFEFIKPGSSNELLVKLVNEDKETIDTTFGKIPTLDLLFTIKDSHKYKKFNNSPAHFWKTLVDWHLMKTIGCSVRDEYKQFLKLREKESYNYNHPSLTNQTKESFFSDSFYVYDHDSLHESQKYLDKPAYQYYALDGDPIKSDKKKFFACDHQTRLYGALEEISVLALERAVIPAKEKWTLESAWKYAFAKVLTSITSGFFREWCYNNALEILKGYPKDYYEKFQQAVKDGKVRLATK